MQNKQRTEISITTDTEFSIAGHFSDPEKCKPVSLPLVYGECQGQQQGLGFMLEAFARYQIQSTFFVETANVSYFGDDPMQRVIRDIQSAGQDVQLHIHPVWLSFKDNSRFPRQDDCSGQSGEYLKDVFQTCIEHFTRLTGCKPVAIRTGNLRADRSTYKIMYELGIRLSSNLAMGVFKPADKSLWHNSGRHCIEGVMEMPVTTYQDRQLFGQHQKSLQITSCSWPEMRYLLWQARRAGVEQIIILTHPFEFFKAADNQYHRLNRNRVNQKRLLRLCEFIQQHDQDFISADFANGHAAWTSSEASHKVLRVPDHYAIGRKIHNKINDLIWCY